MRRVAVTVLLLCATAHCVLSIFYVNTSYLNLHDYANGTAPEPFQRRFLMVPVVHWAESSALLQSLAARYGQNVPQPEPMSAAKLICILVGLLCLGGFGLWTTGAAKRLRIRHWWLLWTLVLLILYASYAARYEQALWYPYDLPHLVVFGLATAFVLMDRPVAFAVAFSVDAPLRETAVFLLPLASLLQFRSRKWRFCIAACAAVWIAARLIAQRLYPHGAHQWNGLHWYAMLKPWHLPQLFSIVGFLWLAVWLGVRSLTREERLSLYAASAMMLLTFYFATWNETRAWSEWTVLFAILGSVQLERGWGTQSD
jgi:hypothetical protein